MLLTSYLVFLFHHYYRFDYFEEENPKVLRLGILGDVYYGSIDIYRSFVSTINADPHNVLKLPEVRTVKLFSTIAVYDSLSTEGSFSSDIFAVDFLKAIYLVSKYNDIKIIYPLSTLNIKIIARENISLERISELKGAIILIDSLNTSDVVLPILLKNNISINFSNLEVIKLGYQLVNVSYLESFDFIIAPEPWASALEFKSWICILNLRELLYKENPKKMPFYLLITSLNKIKNRATYVREFLKGLVNYKDIYLTNVDYYMEFLKDFYWGIEGLNLNYTYYSYLLNITVSELFNADLPLSDFLNGLKYLVNYYYPEFFENFSRNIYDYVLIL